MGMYQPDSCPSQQLVSEGKLIELSAFSTQVFNPIVQDFAPQRWPLDDLQFGLDDLLFIAGLHPKHMT
jgi:hypothetical protein